MLEIKNLSKSFKISDSRSTLVLNNISFSLPNKGMFFILGKSGCGKSTLLNILSGLLTPDGGEVLFNGKDINKLSKKEHTNYLRHQIGILFQRYNLIEDMTVEENLSTTKSIKSIKSADRIESLLTKYGLIDKKKQKAYLLSGGEKQRIALIRTLLNDPKIIFCDEPTGALDEENSIKMMEELKEISKDRLVVMVTHNESLFKSYYDGYIYLENGEIKDKKLIEINDEIENIDLKTKNIDTKFIGDVANKNIKKNFKRNLINTFSAFFTITVLLLSLFIKDGISNSKEKLLNTYGDKNTFSVSMIKSESIDDSPLALERLERPTHNQIQTLLTAKDYVIDYSYDYFFSNKCELLHGKSLEKKLDGFKVKPILMPSLKEDECLMNSLLYNKIQVEPILKEIGISIDNSYSYISPINSTSINEVFQTTFYVKVAKIVDEFDYLNTPIIYVQTTFLEKIFRNLKAKNSSLDRDENITAYDLLTEANNNSEISSYKMNVFSFRKDDNQLFYKLLEEKNKNDIFKIENFGFTMVTSFLDISNSVFLGMNIFIAIAILTTLFINGFLAYSSALLNRKESAILSSLGATNDEVGQIYLLEQLGMSAIGVLIGVIVSFGLSYLLNYYFGMYLKFNNLINYNWIDVFLIVIAFVACLIVAAIIPLKVMKTKNIALELKEE